MNKIIRENRTELICKEKKWLNTSVVIYGLFLVVYRMLSTISLFWENVYLRFGNIIAIFTVCFGILILMYDLFHERTCLKTTGHIGLFIIMLATMLTTFVHTQYAFIENVKSVIWMVIHYFCIYPSIKRLDENRLKQILKYTYLILFVIYSVAAVVSFKEFLFMESGEYYVSDEHIHWGFWEARLYGVFKSILDVNVSSLLIFFAGVWFCLCDSGLMRVIGGVAAVLSFIYMVLAGSRIIIVCFLTVIMCFSVFVFRNKDKNLMNILKVMLKRLIFVVLVFSVFLVLYKTADSGLKSIVLDISSKNEHKTESVTEGKTEEENQELTIERQDVYSGDISNNRFYIWKDYMHLLLRNQESFFLGYTPSGYGKMIRDVSPDIYIVQYWDNKEPLRKERGDVYSPHNSYLAMFVMCGLIGFTGLMIFLCALFTSIHRWYQKKEEANINPEIYLYITVLVVYLTLGLVDTDFFFARSTGSTIFWVVCGRLTSFLEMNEETKDCVVDKV